MDRQNNSTALAQLGLSPSSTSSKPPAGRERAALHPSPSTHNVTRRSLLQAAANTPLFQPQGSRCIPPLLLQPGLLLPHKLSTFIPHTSLTLQEQLCFCMLEHRPSSASLRSARMTYQDTAIPGEGGRRRFLV